ncbi:MAG: hypothetical protein AAF126_25495, partial [Chloroflexota bacterium]
RGIRHYLTLAVLFIVMVGFSLPFLGLGYAALWERFPAIYPYESLANIIFMLLWITVATLLTVTIMRFVRWLYADNSRKQKPTL